MTALTQEVAIKDIQEKIRDMQQSIQSLGDIVRDHSKNALDDRALVVQLGELVNKLVLQREQEQAMSAAKTPPPRKTDARQARK